MSEPLFSEYDLRAVLRDQTDRAQREVDSYNEDDLLTVSETDLVKHLTSRYTVDEIQLGETCMLEPVEVEVDVSSVPLWGASMRGKRLVKGHRVEIHLPFTGDPRLFRCCPTSFSYSAPHAEIHEGHLVLTVDRPGALDAAEVKKIYEIAIAQITSYLNNINSECSTFNSGLESRVHSWVSQRKSRLLQMRQAAATIGLPIKRRTDAPQTYVVPNVRRKAQVEPPKVGRQVFMEPALDETEYENILSIIRGMVRVMELSPKAFTHMGEEDLRTHFLVQLNGQYQGRASGETFNYQGKTDILIREGDRNVFIAECKIWKGETEFLKAIDQILGYLHWRDTKSALVIFNRNKSFSEVLEKILPAVQSHSCCKRSVKKVSETEWRFLFCNPDDSNRELQLAVMLFDVPKQA